MFLTGAEILIKSLLGGGVDTIPGYPGDAVLNIYDELHRHGDRMNHILAAHEQGTTHASDEYVKATGKVGVRLATSGPGATNLITRIATTYMDSIPMVAITGNATKQLLGKDSFQGVDITGITVPIAKRDYIVKDVNDLQGIIREASYITKEGRPGPVLVDIPEGIITAKAKYEPIMPKEVRRKAKYVTDKALEEVAALINKTENPSVYTGGGAVASEAFKELREFAEKMSSPIATSLMAISAFPYNHPLYTGMIRMRGTKASSILATKRDLLINLGARFSDRVINNQKGIKNAKVICMDVDPAEVNKNIEVDSLIVSGLKIVLQELIPLLKEKKDEEWLNQMNELKSLDARDTSVTGELAPEFLFKELSELDDGSFVIATGAGQHQAWATQYFDYKYPRSFISSSGFGTVGFGLGALIEAQIALKNKQVSNTAGGGSFGMNYNELVIAVESNLPVIIVIVNNNSLGMVRQWQNFFYEARYSSTTSNRSIDFVKLVEAFEGIGFRVCEKEELESALGEALEFKGPVVIDCVVSNDKKVFPVVAPGAPINEVIDEEGVDN